MNVRPGLIFWLGLYENGAFGLAVGRRAHWWIDLVIPPRVVFVLRLVAIVLVGMVFYGELLHWHDLYQLFLDLLRYALWLEHPA